MRFMYGLFKATILMAWSIFQSAFADDGGTGYFKYSIDMEINGQPYSYSQYIQCYKALQISEGPEGPLYLRTQSTGGSWVATRIDSSRTLIFPVQSDCLNSAPRDLALPVSLLETVGSLSKLYIVRKDLNIPSFSLSVKRIHLDPVDSVPGVVGPTKEIAQYTKSVLAEQSHQFQSITARIIPHDIWATSEQSRIYFGQISSIAIAKVGEAPPVSGREDTFVQFPFYRERAYKNADGRIKDMKKTQFIYNGLSFEVSDNPVDDVKVFYSTVGMDNSWTALVDFKGTMVNVLEIQEVYDPETRKIYSLLYSKAKNLEELLNIYARRNETAFR
jgi:hypothetical protein